MRMSNSTSLDGLSTSWHLYILECCDGTLYTGITSNLERRLRQHNSGVASKYTRARKPVKMVYAEPCKDRSEASKREIQVKKLNRNAKVRLIQSLNCDLSY